MSLIRRWGNPAIQAFEGVRELSWDTSTGPPLVLAFHPIARMNPYQSLLYSQAWELGVVPVALGRMVDLDPVQSAAQAAGACTVLHLHWTNGITRAAETLDDAKSLVEEFTDQLARFKSAGGRLVWTVHNVRPHGCRFPDLENQLRRHIADQCDLIHTMTKTTPALVSQHYELPHDKILHVPHPSYTGAYATSISKRQARFELEVGFNELVWGFIGEVRSNKGLDLLGDALDEIAVRHPQGAFRLLLAGKHPDGMDMGTYRRLRRHPWVSTWPTRIPHDDMPTFIRATDAVLLPYDESLNSGMAHLAATMDRPVIAARIGGMTELMEEMPGLLFDPGDASSLADAMLMTAGLDASETAAMAARFTEARDPSKMSTRLMTAISDIASDR